MDFLENFKKEFSGKERTVYTQVERLAKLQIDPERRAQIEGLRFEKIDVNEEAYSCTKFAVIPVAEIIGINRQDNVKNWIECLFNLHKQRIFDEYSGREQYEEFLLGGEQSRNDLPHVIEYKGKYYVAANGKHRITLAKCLGIQKVPVLVSTRP